MTKLIFTALAPNTQWDDVWLALRLICAPWRWRRGEAVAALEAQFRAWLPAQHAYACVSGRSGLYAILKALALPPETEVLLQAYTCVAVPDPILWAGAKPVYVDCEVETFNMLPEDLERKITPRARVVIVQHTFGLPANLDALLTIARKHGLFVIEDCAHALGATYHGQRVGTFGDAAFFSFGRDKVISSVFGGLVVTSDNVVAQRIKNTQQGWKYPSGWWTFQQLLHPLITAKAKFLWRVFGLGKLILAIAKICHLTSKAVYGLEKSGGKPSFIEKRLPNALAQLTLHQFKKLEKFNAHRRKIADVYNTQLLKNPHLISPLSRGRTRGSYDGHIYLRYTMLTPKATQILAAAKQQNIFLGDWYRTPIAPEGVDYGAVGYTLGSCPVAEKLARESVNLPTDIHIGEQEVNRIVVFLTHFG
ncbi:aminotransferase class I/II-fold pyridoxal phosphate-dependent enzyme [Candidatus Uhrbacteria bacterium]|nr:aminotransferase class I/II-fold pyridoxal phosphate-dependent enzyme [Candidatus Uhrbacteria bacterium]